MERRRLKQDEGGMYFANPGKVECVNSGCELLNCVLGGGWAIGRTSNIVGDKSTGKTLLAIEAMANFHLAYKDDGEMVYRDGEAAFDKPYAERLGLPTSKVDFGSSGPCDTVEDFFKDVTALLKRLKKKKQRGMYILDSLDSIGNAAELAGDFGDNGYGMQKPKAMSELFRRLIRELEAKNCTLIIISQVRDAIGAVYGRKTTRTGGRALDFYASQILYLAGTGKIYRTIDSVKRPIGVDIIAKCDKNKIGLPYRDCKFPIMFSFGIDDVKAGVDWLVEVKKFGALGVGKAKEDAAAYLRGLVKMNAADFRAERDNVAALVRREWAKIEASFAPVRSKY